VRAGPTRTRLDQSLVGLTLAFWTGLVAGRRVVLPVRVDFAFRASFAGLCGGFAAFRRSAVALHRRLGPPIWLWFVALRSFVLADGFLAAFRFHFGPLLWLLLAVFGRRFALVRFAMLGALAFARFALRLVGFVRCFGTAAAAARRWLAFRQGKFVVNFAGKLLLDRPTVAALDRARRNERGRRRCTPSLFGGPPADCETRTASRPR